MLGDILREEREKKGLTIKDVEQGTSIRGLYIEAIEKGEYDVLPGEVYLKGFIRSYADYLKLDAAEMLQKYYTEKAPAGSPAAAVVEPPAPVARETIVPKERYQETQAKDDFRERVENSRKSQKIIAGIVAAGVLLGGAYWAFGSDAAPSDTKPAAPKSVASAPAKAKEEPAAAPEKKYTDVEVSAEFSDKCWTKIVADDKTVFEGTVKAGEKMSWKAQKQLVITAGNAGALEVVHNGKNVGTLGKSGDVVTKKFSLDKVENAE